MPPARDVARLLAVGRIAIGAALVLAPRRAARGWIGPDAGSGGASVLGRALGIRDLVLGAMALHTLDHPDVAPRWQRTLAGIDAVDLLATVAARRELPRSGVALTVVMATAGSAGHAWAAGRLAAEPEPVPEPQP